MGDGHDVMAARRLTRGSGEAGSAGQRVAGDLSVGVLVHVVRGVRGVGEPDQFVVVVADGLAAGRARRREVGSERGPSRDRGGQCLQPGLEEVATLDPLRARAPVLRARLGPALDALALGCRVSGEQGTDLDQ